MGSVWRGRCIQEEMVTVLVPEGEVRAQHTVWGLDLRFSGGLEKMCTSQISSESYRPVVVLFGSPFLCS